jgi:Tfp pilus assembly PilM family ATPase
MQTDKQVRWWTAWRRRQAMAWGGLLDEHEILLAALSRQPSGGVRVMVFEHLHAPGALVAAAERDDWLVQTLRQSGAHLPSGLRTMALALREGRCRHGTLRWPADADADLLEAEVQLEAATALGVGPDEVGFDFHGPVVEHPVSQRGHEVSWAACLLSELARWREHARSAGWRLPIVEPEQQAARRAALCLRGDLLLHAAQSPQDWQFATVPERELSEPQWQQLQASPMWGPLVACGAALGALR